MKLSARNVFKGKVKRIAHGAINSEITVEIQGSLEVVSMITKASAERLGLAEGREVHVAIKASNVMIVVD